MNINFIERIEHYNTAWDLIENAFPEARIAELSDELVDTLQHVDDFEWFDYYVINDEDVYIVDGGSVINSCTLETFLSDSIAYCENEMDV